MFFISAAVYVVGAVLFDVLCSGEEQVWNKPRYERLPINENSISNGKVQGKQNMNNSSSNNTSDIDEDSDVKTNFPPAENLNVKT